MISAIVIAKNEEKSLSACLASLQWCDEVVVIDDNSDDATFEIAKKHGAKVLRHHLVDFSSQRNFGIEQTKGEWIFFLDADEIVSEDLQREILAALSQPSKDAYMIRRVDMLWGKEIHFGDAGRAKFVRLAKKGSGKWKGKVHEVWEIKGEVSLLQNPIIHSPHPTVANFLADINLYSTIRAQELKEEHIRSGVLQVIFYPKAKFIYLYFFKLGLLDGMQGFVSAIMMSFYSFLVRGKLWLLWQRKSE